VTTAIEPRQVLTCRVGCELFGIDFLWVRDVVFAPAIVAMADMPAWIAGGMTMGTDLAPVVDLRARLGFVPHPDGDGGPVVGVHLGPVRAGLRVDGVCDVVALRREALDVAVARPFVYGLLRAGERVVEVLDLGELLGR